MSKWNDDKELFKLMKEKLYTPVVGDILDTMGYVCKGSRSSAL
jgi:4-hydroxy-4-methyl-2-oxoglutarate aldolase